MVQAALRHCAINNMRLVGNDYFRIMAASGHKTTAVFKRYNLVTEKELSEMKWLDEEKVVSGKWTPFSADGHQTKKGLSQNDLNPLYIGSGDRI